MIYANLLCFLDIYISKKDINYITDNYQKIDSFIKSFCPSNHIIYISHYKELSSLPIDVYIVEKDVGDWITRIPLLKDNVLANILQNTYIDKKETNKIFSQKMHKKFSLERAVRRFLKKEYVHSKIYKK